MESGISSRLIGPITPPTTASSTTECYLASWLKSTPFCSSCWRKSWAKLELSTTIREKTTCSSNCKFGFSDLGFELIYFEWKSDRCTKISEIHAVSGQLLREFLWFDKLLLQLKIDDILLYCINICDRRYFLFKNILLHYFH